MPPRGFGPALRGGRRRQKGDEGGGGRPGSGGTGCGFAGEGRGRCRGAARNGGAGPFPGCRAASSGDGAAGSAEFPRVRGAPEALRSVVNVWQPPVRRGPPGFLLEVLLRREPASVPRCGAGRGRRLLPSSFREALRA